MSTRMELAFIGPRTHLNQTNQYSLCLSEFLFFLFFFSLCWSNNGFSSVLYLVALFYLMEVDDNFFINDID